MGEWKSHPAPPITNLNMADLELQGIFTSIKCGNPSCNFLCIKLKDMVQHSIVHEGQACGLSCLMLARVDECKVVSFEDIQGAFIHALAHTLAHLTDCLPDNYCDEPINEVRVSTSNESEGSYSATWAIPWLLPP